jgi:hypothetical protein
VSAAKRKRSPKPAKVSPAATSDADARQRLALDLTQDVESVRADVTDIYLAMAKLGLTTNVCVVTTSGLGVDGRDRIELGERLRDVLRDLRSIEGDMVRLASSDPMGGAS